MRSPSVARGLFQRESELDRHLQVRDLAVDHVAARLSIGECVRMACSPLAVSMSAPFTSDSEPGWFRWLSALVMRLGLLRATAALTAIVIVLAAGIAQLVVTLAGHGDRIMALVSA